MEESKSQGHERRHLKREMYKKELDTQLVKTLKE